MTLRILDPNDGTQNYLSFADFFDLNNPGEYELYEDCNYTAPVDFLIQNAVAYYPNYDKYNFKRLLFLDTRHNSEDKIAYLHNNKTDRIVVTMARDFTIDDPRILFNDYEFNMTKAYYLGYNFAVGTKPWRLDYKSDFVITEPTAPENKHKIYIAPNRTYFDPELPRQRFYRAQLMQLLKSKYRSLGHLGNVTDPDIGGLRTNSDLKSPIGFRPPHDRYYQDSFISIYGETLEYGSTFASTEKTFSPLIKGHFVLPYSTYKFIENIKKCYGFQFPDFIDYSYDNIADDAQRYQAYSAEVERLLAIPIDTWREHWCNNLVLIRANQQIFRDRDYHRTDLTSILE
jgi:hypothetical protein